MLPFCGLVKGVSSGEPGGKHNAVVSAPASTSGETSLWPTSGKSEPFFRVGRFLNEIENVVEPRRRPAACDPPRHLVGLPYALGLNLPNGTAGLIGFGDSDS